MILRPLWQWGAGETPSAVVAAPVWAHTGWVRLPRLFGPRLRALWVETGSTVAADPALDTFRW